MTTLKQTINIVSVMAIFAYAVFLSSAFAAVPNPSSKIDFAPAALQPTFGADIQADSQADFEIAHFCVAWRVHVGNNVLVRGEAKRHGISGDSHDGPAQCAKKSWIQNCIRQNRVVDVTRGGHCGEVCPPGEFVDQSDGFANANLCTASEESCAKVGAVFAFAPNTSVLNLTCEPCPEGTKVQAGNRCVDIGELEKWCADREKLYDPVSNNCVERCADDETLSAGRCVSFSELKSYCDGLGKAYNPASNECEQKCPEGQAYTSDGRCASFENIAIYACTSQRKLYDPVADACVERCPRGKHYAAPGICVHFGEKMQRDCESSGQTFDVELFRCVDNS